MRKLMGAMPGVALALLAGCTTPAGARSGAASTSPEGVAWRLVSISGEPARTGGGEGPTLRLHLAEHRATGNTGCNGYSGPYELRGDSIRFGALVSTRRACVEEAMNRQEGAFMTLLRDARSWRITGDTLALTAPGATASFVRAAQ
jgi:heat shock protein HslJ